MNRARGGTLTAGNNYTLNAFVVRGTAFLPDSVRKSDNVDVALTESPETFVSRNNSSSPSSVLSCICIGPRWSLEIETTISVLQLLPPEYSVLIPAKDSELAHLIGVLGMPSIIEYSNADSIDWAAVVKLLVSPSAFPSSIWKKKSPKYSAALGKKTVVFSDPKSKAMLALIQRVAAVEVTTLLSGASGVGKEVIARILHGASTRADMPFVPLNCSAIPEQLVESILFGHVKGSFTGAIKDQVGIFEEANGGTLFLDEVGELPLHIQPKLLRALQERKVVRVGSSKERGFDVRLVAATNKDLSGMVASGSFREDLFYRLNAFHVGIPQLSERPLDVKELAIKLAANHEMAGIKMEITEAAVDRLLEHSWPGNIRELENVICRAKVLALDGLIDVQHILFDAMNFAELGADIEAKPPELEMAPVQMVRSDHLISPKSKLRRLDEARDSTELDVIESAIREAGSKKEAAQRLGISPRTLRHKLQRLKQSQLNKQPALGYK